MAEKAGGKMDANLKLIAAVASAIATGLAGLGAGNAMSGDTNARISTLEDKTDAMLYLLCKDNPTDTVCLRYGTKIAGR